MRQTLSGQSSRNVGKAVPQLSPDVLQHMFAFLDTQDRAHAAAVCWSWRLAVRRSVTSIRLCASTPFDYYAIYPSVQEVYVCEPSLGATSGATPSTVLHLQRLERLPNLRHLDLSGLSALQTDADITTTCTFLKYTLAKSSTLDCITLPSSVKQSSWDLAWLGSVPGLQRVNLNGTSFKTLKSRGLRISVLCPLHTVQVKLTDDASMQHKDHITSLRDVSVAFGHGQRAPSAESLAELLNTWTDLTRLNFTFAQSFSASKMLMEAIASLNDLKDLQMNSFDIMHLAADDLVCMSELKHLQRMELSGLNMVGERLHSWMPHLRALTQLTLALTFPSTWDLLLPTALRELEISNILNEERRCPPRVILDLTRLTCLSINCVRGVDDVFLRRLKSMPALQKCSLTLTNITGRAFKHMCWQQLTFLSIGSFLDGCNIIHIGEAFPRLKELRIVHCHNISTLEGLCAPALTHIVISGRHRLTLQSLLQLAHCKSLQRINVTWTSFHVRPQNTRTSTAQLLQALSPLTALTELKLRGSSGPLRASHDRLSSLARLFEKVPGVTALKRRRLMALVPGLQPAAPPLRQLIMAGCETVRDKDLAALAGSPQAGHLTLLSLAGCVKITGRGFDSIACLRFLRRLDLSQCPRLSNVAILRLTNTRSLPEKPKQTILPGLHSLLACTWTYLNAAMCTIPCQQRVHMEEDNFSANDGDGGFDNEDRQDDGGQPSSSAVSDDVGCSRNMLPVLVTETQNHLTASTAQKTPPFPTATVAASQLHESKWHVCAPPGTRDSDYDEIRAYIQPANTMDAPAEDRIPAAWTASGSDHSVFLPSHASSTAGCSRRDDRSDIKDESRPLPVLRELSLACDQVPKNTRSVMSSAALQCLQKLSSVEWLNLDGRPVNLTALDTLSAALTRLTYLSLDDCYGAGPELKELSQFVLKLGQWPDLREVSIRGMVVLPETVSELLRCRPTLSLWHDGVLSPNAPEAPSED